MSKTKTIQVEVVDDDLLKMLLEKISVLQAQVNSLSHEVGILKVDSKSLRGKQCQ